MMDVKKLFVSASVAALLASPLAAQSDGAKLGPGIPATEEKSGTDNDTVINNEASAESGGRNLAGGAPSEETVANAGVDSPYVPEMMRSDDPMLAGMTPDTSSSFLGTMVKTSDGANVGEITEVMMDAEGNHLAKVNLDQSLGMDTRLAADVIYLKLGMAGDAGGDIVLPQNEVAFVAEMAELSGTKDKN